MKLSLRLVILVPLSAAAFALLFIVPGIDLGGYGQLALLVGAWVIWYLLWQAMREWSAKSRAEDGVAMPSPGEWRAWIGLLFTLAILAYLGMHSGPIGLPDGIAAEDLRHGALRHFGVGNHIAMLIIIWVVVMSVLRRYWRDAIEHDERDRVIHARATCWARVALTVFVIALLVMLAASPLDKLQWVEPRTLAELLLGGLIATSALEYLVAGISYWWDRRGMAST